MPQPAAPGLENSKTPPCTSYLLTPANECPIHASPTQHPQLAPANECPINASPTQHPQADSYILTADVPGVAKEDLTIKLVPSTKTPSGKQQPPAIQVKGTRKSSAAAAPPAAAGDAAEARADDVGAGPAGSMLLKERRRGDFERKVELPDDGECLPIASRRGLCQVLECLSVCNWLPVFGYGVHEGALGFVQGACVLSLLCCLLLRPNPLLRLLPG